MRLMAAVAAVLAAACAGSPGGPPDAGGVWVETATAAATPAPTADAADAGGGADAGPDAPGDAGPVRLPRACRPSPAYDSGICGEEFGAGLPHEYACDAVVPTPPRCAVWVPSGYPTAPLYLCCP